MAMNETAKVCWHCWATITDDRSTCSSCENVNPTFSNPDETVTQSMVQWASENRIEILGSQSNDSGAIQRQDSNSISLGNSNATTIGRDSRSTIAIVNSSVEMQHACIVRSDREDFWIVDLNSQLGTKVNCQNVIAKRLEAGDLIQIADRAWQFSASDSFLIPTSGISGARLDVRELSIKNRLGPVTFSAKPGSFTAVIGGSGAGKSTLLKSIVRGNSDAVFVNENPVTTQKESFKSRLGYVSQTKVVHDDLSPKDVLTFSRDFRQLQRESKNTQHPAHVENSLRNVDIPAARWKAMCRQMSGGELRRIQTAAESMGDPELFILDEPTSGLDPVRELELLKILKSFSHRGSTVIVVTHGIHFIDLFDHIIELEAGQIRFDGSCDEYQRFKNFENREGAKDGEVTAQTDSSNHAQDSPTDQQLTDQQPADQHKSDQQPADTQGDEKFTPANRAGQLFQETLLHLKRETKLNLNSFFKRIVVPLMVVPSFFALAIHLAVPIYKPSLLGLLTIVSSIWIGASLSLLSIVNERKIIEHESNLYVDGICYFISKTLFYFALNSIQTALFLTGLAFLRSLNDSPDDFFYGIFAKVFLWHWLVGLAGVGAGLVISTASKFNSKTANFILPLFMIFQIVFSVQIAGGDRAESDLRPAYQGLKEQNEVVDSLSHLTISRYGDVGLRSFAYSKARELPSGASKDTGYSTWQIRALLSILLFIALSPIAAWLIFRFVPVDYES